MSNRGLEVWCNGREKEIDADFYAKDAKESVDIAKRVLG